MISEALLFLAASGMSIPSADVRMATIVQQSISGIQTFAQSFAADVDLWIAPDGKIESCTVRRYAGNEEGARQVCAALIEYPIGSPKSTDGSLVYGDISLGVTGFPDDFMGGGDRLLKRLDGLRQEDDDERYVKLEAIKWEEYWSLLVEIDESGTVTECERAHKKVAKKSAEQACAAISALTFHPRVDQARQTGKIHQAGQGSNRVMRAHSSGVALHQLRRRAVKVGWQSKIA